MIYDTDVVIWMLRGNDKAVDLIESDEDRALSIVSRMELYRGAQNSRELNNIRDLMRIFASVPLTENIGHRAAIFMEQFALKAGLEPMDALIAATASELQQTLCTGNVKHYRQIPGIQLEPFRP